MSQGTRALLGGQAFLHPQRASSGCPAVDASQSKQVEKDGQQDDHEAAGEQIVVVDEGHTPPVPVAGPEHLLPDVSQGQKAGPVEDRPQRPLHFLVIHLQGCLQVFVCDRKGKAPVEHLKHPGRFETLVLKPMEVSVRGIQSSVKAFPQDRPLRCTVILGSFSKFSSIVVSPHSQDILGTVVEFREPIEFTVLEVDGGLVDSIEGSLCLIGFVHKRLEGLPTQVEVSCPPKVQSLPILLDLILNVKRQAGVQERSIRSQASLLTQEPIFLNRAGKQSVFISLPSSITTEPEKCGHIDSVHMFSLVDITPQVEFS